MDLDEHIHKKQARDLMETVAQLEKTAKMCIPHSESKWARWADELHKRIGERKQELETMTSIARRFSAVHGVTGLGEGSASDVGDGGEAPPSSAEVKEEAVGSSADDDGSSDWLRGWNAATAEALPEIQELEQVFR